MGKPKKSVVFIGRFRWVDNDLEFKDEKGNEDPFGIWLAGNGYLDYKQAKADGWGYLLEVTIEILEKM